MIMARHWFLLCGRPGLISAGNAESNGAMLPKDELNRGRRRAGANPLGFRRSSQIPCLLDPEGQQPSWSRPKGTWPVQSVSLKRKMFLHEAIRSMIQESMLNNYCTYSVSGTLCSTADVPSSMLWKELCLKRYAWPEQYDACVKVALQGILRAPLASFLNLWRETRVGPQVELPGEQPGRLSDRPGTAWKPRAGDTLRPCVIPFWTPWHSTKAMGFRLWAWLRHLEILSLASFPVELSMFILAVWDHEHTEHSIQNKKLENEIAHNNSNDHWHQNHKHVGYPYQSECIP